MRTQKSYVCGDRQRAVCDGVLLTRAHPEHETGAMGPAFRNLNKRDEWDRSLVDWPVHIEPWERLAECAKPENEHLRFFLDSRGESYSYEAFACCARCPVDLDCLFFALVNEIDDGLWGGVAPKRRRKLKLEVLGDDGENAPVEAVG